MMVLMSDDAAREEQADVWCFCSVWPAAIIFQIVCHFKKASACISMVLMMGMREKVAGDDEEADEYADEADGADDVGNCHDAAVQY